MNPCKIPVLLCAFLDAIACLACYLLPKTDKKVTPNTRNHGLLATQLTQGIPKKYKINLMILFSFMNSTYKRKTVEQNLDNLATLIKEKKTDALSFVKLHSTLCFLMTRFHTDQCPKLAHFIVSHIRLVLEHPDLADSPNCRALYMQLLQQWQNITAALLKQRRNLAAENKNIH